jgi:aryl-alcohol dehydrogenase-like predicted oxidoreductase
MEFRFLGNSGLKVSAISYGNWVTHGAQVEADQVTACVRAALEAAITTFDTADTYANGRAETILGDARNRSYGRTAVPGPPDGALWLACRCVPLEVPL